MVKKLMIITVMMLAVVGAGIFENIFISSFYDDVADRVEAVIELVESDSFAEAGEELDSVMKDVHGKRHIILLFNDHENERNIFSSMATARVYIRHESKADSSAALEQALEFTRESAREVRLLYYNIF